MIIIIIAEEFWNNPDTLMRKIFDFLGVDPNYKNKSWYNKKFNVGKRPRTKTLQLIRGKLNDIGQYIPILLPLTMPIVKIIDAINLTKGYPRMDSEIRRYLTKYFNHTIEIWRHILN